tara:strand:+ start:445 stop:963 length:519 start_codon:yes stop_codon:yes gene_type:complete
MTNKEELDREETDSEEEQIEDSVDLVKHFLDKIVPPTEVRIQDLYGEEYELKTRISARSQIKLVREFEMGMKDIKFEELFSMDAEINSATILRAMMKVAVKDQVLDSIDRCFKIAHPQALESAKKNARNDPHAPKKPTSLDVFGLEDILSAILPLFLGLVKKGANVLTLLAQ